MPSTTTQPQTLACDKCGRKYPIRPQDAGRAAQCSCGNILRIPAPQGKWSAPRPAPEADVPVQALDQDQPYSDEIIEKAIDAELAETGRYGEDERVDQINPFRDIQVPSALLGIGALMLIGMIVATARVSHLAIIAATVVVLVDLVINLIVMFAGVLLAARFAGICFGPLNLAVLKLSATYIAPTVLAELVSMALGGDEAVTILGRGVAIVCYWGLLSYLFRLDGMQTMICAAAIGLMRIATKMCILGAIVLALTRAFGGGGATVPAPDDDSAMQQLEEEIGDVELDG